MKIVIGNYPDATDSRNLILNEDVQTSEGTTTFALISKVEGLETAPYRNGTGDWSGADGGYISSQLFSARTITISGVYIDRKAGCDFATAGIDQFEKLARLYIRSRLPIRTKQYIRIFTDSGMTFYTEGYCVDIKMDLTYIGSGEYQITMYCPDPALYRGDADGTLGSEWNAVTLRKQNDVGYVSSEMTSEGDHYAYMEYSATLPGNNRGIVWGTGGRSTPVEYTGDYPYYPQFTVSPVESVITNPAFYAIEEDKYFGLGYPEGSAAKFRVAAVGPNGEIASLELQEGGLYDVDYSGSSILLKAYSYVQTLGRTEYGTGATAALLAAPNERAEWTFTSATIKNPGANYVVGDILTPQIDGATILQIYPGQKLVVDMAEHTAMLDGESVAYYVTPGSEWFQLRALSSNNVIFYSSDDVESDAVKIRWRNGYLGI